MAEDEGAGVRPFARTDRHGSGTLAPLENHGLHVAIRPDLEDGL